MTSQGERGGLEHEERVRKFKGGERERLPPLSFVETVGRRGLLSMRQQENSSDDDVYHVIYAIQELVRYMNFLDNAN